jgi:hypothetical protein
MNQVWKDRVWLCLALGPFVWMAIVLSIAGGSVDGVRLLVLYAQGMCASVAGVSIFLPIIRERNGSAPPTS